MSEQSDTPRTIAAQVEKRIRSAVHYTGDANIEPESEELGTLIGLAEMHIAMAVDEVDKLERETVALRARLDAARALNVEWAKKAETWIASPEAASRLQGYRDLGQQVAKAQNERDALRAEVERLRDALRTLLHRASPAHVEDTHLRKLLIEAREVAHAALAATEAK